MPENHWTNLADFAQRLAMARRMDEISKLVIQETRKRVAADGVSFVLRDDEACFYIDDDAISPLWRGLKFPASSCISGWCMSKNQIAVIPDIYLDDRIPHDVYRPTFVKSVVMLPIGGPEPFAAMGVYWSEQPRIDNETISYLRMMASLAASAITSVHLYTFLLHAEKKLSIAHETGALGSYELDARSCKLISSARMREIFGQPFIREMNYSDWVESFYGGDRERLLDALVSACASEKPFALDCTILRSDASFHSIRILGLPSRADHDPDVRILGAVRHVKAVTRAII